VAEYLVLLAAGDDLYAYFGDEPEDVRDRMEVHKMVCVGANLDVKSQWLSPARWPRLKADLVGVLGAEHIHEFEV
jgi:hypothetical protein